MRTAQDLAAGDQRRGVVAEVFESRRTGEDSESSERRVAVTFDPRRDRTAYETITFGDLPPISLSLNYGSKDGSVMCILLQSDQDLLHVQLLGPSNTFVTLRLSPNVSLSLIITHGVRMD